MADHLAVTVERNGERVVAIESNCISGRDISLEDEDAIRTCAYYLLSFIGEGPLPARAVAIAITKRRMKDLGNAGRF